MPLHSLPRKACGIRGESRAGKGETGNSAFGCLTSAPFGHQADLTQGTLSGGGVVGARLDRGTPCLTDLHSWLAPRAMAAATLRPRSGGWCLSRSIEPPAPEDLAHLSGIIEEAAGLLARPEAATALTEDEMAFMREATEGEPGSIRSSSRWGWRR